MEGVIANQYVPKIAVITDITQETAGERAIKTFRTVFADKRVQEGFAYRPGQLCMLSVFGKGESMISITSSPTRSGFLEFSVMRLGKVTEAMHQLDVGDEIGIRGPYGNGFPVDKWRGKSIYFIGGGIGMAPVRSVMSYILDNRKDYGALHLVYGARTSKDIAYRKESEELEKDGYIDVRLTIDIDEHGWFKVNKAKPEETAYDHTCRRFTGFVAETVLALKCNPENAIAITCGPPMMIKTVIQSLKKLGWNDNQIYTTLENKMKCGIGKCGRCNIGSVYVCVDGPVFSYKQVKEMVSDF